MDEEIRNILFMHEEEKLARDVYVNLFEQWGYQSQTLDQATYEAILGSSG